MKTEQPQGEQVRSLAHSLTIRHDSWHGRWYRHWQALGGKAPATENFCHYVRVLLVWAPLKWVIHGKIKGAPAWLAPAAVMVLGVAGLAAYLWPSIALRILEAAGILVGVIVVGLGIIVGSVTLYDRNPARAKRIGRKAARPLVFLGRKIGAFLKRHEQQIESAMDWFIDREYTRFKIVPVQVVGTVIIVSILTWFAVFDPMKLLLLAIAFGGLMLGAVALAGVVWLVDIVEEARAEAPTEGEIPRPQTRAARTYEGVADTVKLGATYVANKKQGSVICPFIRFEDRQAA